MPSPEIANRLQKALLWAKISDDAYGEPVVSAPVEIDVRWVTKRRQATGPDGTPIAIDATVIVNQEIAIGSIMWEGSMAEWVGTGSGEADKFLMQVMTYDETPDLKNRLRAREVSLQFFRGSLPALG